MASLLDQCPCHHQLSKPFCAHCVCDPGPLLDQCLCHHNLLCDLHSWGGDGCGHWCWGRGWFSDTELLGELGLWVHTQVNTVQLSFAMLKTHETADACL